MVEEAGCTYIFKLAALFLSYVSIGFGTSFKRFRVDRHIINKLNVTLPKIENFVKFFEDVAMEFSEHSCVSLLVAYLP